MADFSLTGKAVAVAAVVAAFTLLLVAWPWRRSPAWQLRLGWVLGTGAGFYAGCAVVDQWPRWPAPEDRDRLLVILLPLTLTVEIVTAVVPRRPWLAWLLRLGVAGAAAPILLYNSVYLTDLAGPNSAEWSTTQAAWILLLLATALAVGWALLARLQARTPDPSLAPSLVLASLAAGVTVMLSGYFKGGLLALPVAGAVAGTTVASFAAPRQPTTSRFLGVSLVGLFAVLVIGRFFGSLPTSTGVWLFLTPLLAWLPELPGVRRLWPGVREPMRLAVVAVSLFFVVMNAHEKFVEASATNSSSGVP